MDYSQCNGKVQFCQIALEVISCVVIWLNQDEPFFCFKTNFDADIVVNKNVLNASWKLEKMHQ